ncbi:unnamed protein product [Meganyctiphanes norvegica]|uniref:Uncharacterized protein n=1 Tax=Meganyctiphanes norvegica TaxID=48144 RepID=A0AAV2RPQ6_MEGNR
MMNVREHTKYVLAKSGYEPEEKKCCSRRCKCCSCVVILTLAIVGAAIAVYLVMFHPWGPTEVCTNGVFLPNNNITHNLVVLNSKVGIKIFPLSGNETQLHYIRAMVMNGTEKELVYNLEENDDQTWTMFTEVSGSLDNNPVNIPAPGLPVNQWLYLSFNKNANETTTTIELQTGEISYKNPALNVTEGLLEPDFYLQIGGYNSSAPYEISYNC